MAKIKKTTSKKSTTKKISKKAVKKSTKKVRRCFAGNIKKSK